jgi:hypothetical protein
MEDRAKDKRKKLKTQKNREEIKVRYTIHQSFHIQYYENTEQVRVLEGK